VNAAAVDLRSDTVTRPTPAMREAIASAEVGDDVLGDDPTVKRLEARIAELLGKQAALLFPSGVMANQTAVLALSRPGTEVVIEASGHILDWEESAAAAWSGVQLRPVATADGLLDAALLARSLRPASPYVPETSLICLENTHNAAGGRVLSLAAMREIRDLARERALPVHLDGARLWHASEASGVAEREFADCADTVMVTLSKGLGCPVGSMLAGTAEVMQRAWRIRRRLGGGMRQAGILAAAGIHALEHHRGRLGEDHRRARVLADGVRATPGITVVQPETNIVMLDLGAGLPGAAEVVAGLAARGVLLSPFGARRVRAVTHLDVDDAGIDRAVAAIRAVAAT
jgi:threonine aldolase